MEDYTNKYKGEQVEVALFGGEYQDGVLTAYCYVDDVAHIELNGHILIPLQNIASLHCSSRCDAPEPDWPPQGLAEDEPDERDDETRSPVRHAVGGRPQPAEGLARLPRAGRGARRARLAHRRLPVALLFGGSVALLGAVLYWYADRIAMGMVGARELLPAEAPALHCDGRALSAARRRRRRHGST